MPYINSCTRRKYCARQISTFESPGQLNFAVTDLINIYLNDKGLSYQTINDIAGALEGAKLEFYRRIAVPHEDNKRDLNGDVYTGSGVENL